MEGPPTPRNILLTVAYDGTAYSGWQIQPRDPTVQGELERLLGPMTGHPCRLRAAGRTDAGVHALGQAASFRTSARVPLRGFVRGLNAQLPGDIAVCAAEEMPVAFNARYHNHGKHYRYAFWNQRVPSPQHRLNTMHVFGRLDTEAMARGAALLVGRHDFAAFRAASCERLTTVRTLHRCSVARQGPLVLVDVEGTGFLKNMVRIIAGTLLEVGLRRRGPEQIAEALRSGKRTDAGLTAPPTGLTLVRVFVYRPVEGAGDAADLYRDNPEARASRARR